MCEDWIQEVLGLDFTEWNVSYWKHKMTFLMSWYARQTTSLSQRSPASSWEWACVGGCIQLWRLRCRHSFVLPAEALPCGSQKLPLLAPYTVCGLEMNVETYCGHLLCASLAYIAWTSHRPGEEMGTAPLWSQKLSQRCCADVALVAR